MKTKHLRLMQRTYIILFFGFMLHNSSILRALAVSVEVALVSAVVATILGTAASLGIAGMKRTSRLVITNVTYIPVVNPEIITGISLMLLFVAYQRFAAGVPWLPDTIMGMPTLLIAHVAFNVPYVIFNVSPKLRQLDVHLYEAALDLGCDPRQALVSPEIYALSTIMFAAILAVILISNAAEGRRYRRDLTAQQQAQM